jgi:hypothetical protein
MFCIAYGFFHCYGRISLLNMLFIVWIKRCMAFLIPPVFVFKYTDRSGLPVLCGPLDEARALITKSLTPKRHIAFYSDTGQHRKKIL